MLPTVTAHQYLHYETGYQFLGWYDATNSKVYKRRYCEALGGSDVTLTAVCGSTVAWRLVLTIRAFRRSGLRLSLRRLCTDISARLPG